LTTSVLSSASAISFLHFRVLGSFSVMTHRRDRLILSEVGAQHNHTTILPSSSLARTAQTTWRPINLKSWRSCQCRRRRPMSPVLGEGTLQFAPLRTWS
jgi:hypothetical protein